MHSYLKVFSLAILSIGAFSCAKEASVNSNAIEDKIVESYFQQQGYDKDPSWVHKASGLYSKTLAEGTGATPTYADWIMIKYQGKTLNGNIFQTIDTTTFMELGYNLNYFHIVPDFIYMSGNMPQAFRESLLEMKEGGKVDLIIPSYLGFGAYGAVKFGQMPILPDSYVPANSAIRYTLELVKVISKPTEYDSLKVVDYANEHPGFTSIKDYPNVKFKMVKAGSTLPADTIGNGTVVKVFYAGFFLDKIRTGVVPPVYVPFNKPYCFDTNIDSVAAGYLPNLINYTSSTSGTLTKSDTLSVTLSASQSSVVKGFELALRQMTSGAEAEVVFTSTYGYGITGNSSSTVSKPSIAPYTPLRFFIKVASVENSSTSTSSASSVVINSIPQYLRKN